MFCPHTQGIRSSKTFQRNGPHVHKLDKSSALDRRKMWRGQCATNESKKLDKDNFIKIIPNFLSPAERIEYIQESYRIDKIPSRCGNNIQNEFTRNGKPYSFNPNQHTANYFKKHVIDISKKILDKISINGENLHNLMDSATEFEYGVEMANGGNIIRQNDVDGDWKHVAFYGLGQTRYLRITKENARGFINIPILDNSLVICSGEQFQKNYFHQVDNLPVDHPMGTSILLKTRFRKPRLSGTKVI